MWTRLGISLVLGLALTGCRVCGAHGQELLERARAGEPAAIHELGEVGTPRVPSALSTIPVSEAFKALIPVLEAPQPRLRLLALESLRRLATRAKAVQRAAFPALFDDPLADPEPRIRWRAAWALGRVRLDRPALRAAVDDPDPRVAERAAWAVAQIEGD